MGSLHTQASAESSDLLENTRGKWLVLFSVGMGTFMTALDGSVTNTILPVIRSSFGVEIASIEWVVTIYLLVLSGLLLSFGRLGDMRGHKLVFLSGFGVFVSPNNSALMGPAPRHRQGIAAGILATARNFGMVLGVGLSGAIFTTILARSAESGAAPGLFAATQTSFNVACGVALLGIITSVIRKEHN
jgi:MFS family permease